VRIWGIRDGKTPALLSIRRTAKTTEGDSVKSILDRTFRYTPSANTDIRKTIQRERKRLAELKAKSNVAPLKRAKS
jgi:hypothetical protein